MKAQRWITAAIVLASAVTAYAQQPASTTQPRFDSPARREWTRQGLPVDAAGDEEIEQFMRTHSPHRWKQMQELSGERRENILRSIRQQYRWMQRLKDEDSEVYELRLKRLPIEDQMFYLGWRIRHDDPESPDELKSQLRRQVRAFHESSLAERRLRLARWRERLQQAQAVLQREEQRLADAEAQREAMIERGVDHVLDERPRMLKEWAGPMFAPMPRQGPEGEPPPVSSPSEP